MINIYDQISHNRYKTIVIVLCFVIFISILGYILGEFVLGYGAGIGVMISAFGFSVVSSFISYFTSDKIVLAIAKAKKVDREASPEVYGILENLCVGAGIKKVPELFIIEDSAPNAFATGRDPQHSSIAVTTGLLSKLNKRQIEGVLAHELSHVRNYDILVMTITVVLVGTVTMVANIIGHSRFSGGGSKRDSGIVLAVGIILALLSPVIAELIKLAVSRSREYLADASAALLTRDPEGLAQALEIIATDKEPLEVANEATAHLYISNPLKKGINSDRFASFFSTHPPIEERVRILRAM